MTDCDARNGFKGMDFQHWLRSRCLSVSAEVFEAFGDEQASLTSTSNSQVIIHFFWTRGFSQVVKRLASEIKGSKKRF